MRKRCLNKEINTYKFANYSAILEINRNRFLLISIFYGKKITLMKSTLLKLLYLLVNRLLRAILPAIFGNYTYICIITAFKTAIL